MGEFWCEEETHCPHQEYNCISVLLLEVIGSVTVLGFEGSGYIVQKFQ